MNKRKLLIFVSLIIFLLFELMLLQLILDICVPTYGKWLNGLEREIIDFFFHPVISLQLWWNKWHFLFNL